MNFVDKETYSKYLSLYENFQEFILNGFGNKKSCKTLIEKVIHLIPQTNFLVNNDGELCVAKKILFILRILKKNLKPIYIRLEKNAKSCLGKIKVVKEEITKVNIKIIK